MAYTLPILVNRNLGLRISHDAVIEEVAVGSQADLAGFRADFRIISINGNVVFYMLGDMSLDPMTSIQA